MSESNSAWSTAISQLEIAALRCGLDADVLEFLKRHQRIFICNFAVRMDDGKINFFEGYRIHHCHALGAIGGGTRFHPQETLDDVKALSLWMTIKNSLNGIPVGGGKGGVVCDPSKLSKAELERVCRTYIRSISPMIGTWIDFPGADIGTDSQTQSWMLDEWEQIHGMVHEPASISGKYEELGGSQGRPEATGLGVMFAAREACKTLNFDIKEMTLAIQGFGKVGSWAARLLFDAGARVVALCDVFGGLYNPNGMNPYELMDYVKKTGKMSGFKNGESISKEELLGIDCDILIPAAMQSVISEKEAMNVKSKIVVEAANGPTTPSGEKCLLERGIFIVPDILANGGGTVVAHLEKVQCLMDNFWTADTVHHQYDQMFVQCYRDVLDISKNMGVSMRMAAWFKALKRLEIAIKRRGWV